ncbi:MAG: ArsR/SmtB family transcription factor [Opitutales bacterium]|jgi:ArsR family transcriptional regulator
MPGVKQATHPPKVETICLGLSDPTRLRLLSRIGGEEVCVCDLQAFVKRDQPTVSRHLAMLRKCGLVEARKEGRWCHYRRTQLPPALARIVDLAAPPARRPGRSCC